MNVHWRTQGSQLGLSTAAIGPTIKWTGAPKKLALIDHWLYFIFSIKPPFLLCPVKLVLSVFLIVHAVHGKMRSFSPASVRITRPTCCVDLKLYCANTNYYCVVMLSLTFEEIVSLCVSNFNYQVLTVIDMFPYELLCFLYHEIPLMLSRLAFLFPIPFSGKNMKLKVVKGFSQLFSSLMAHTIVQLLVPSKY